MQYEMIRLAQLVFALALMFGAFLGGLAVGWLRWGRRTEAPSEEARDVPRPSLAVPRLVKRDLFSPESESDAGGDGTTTVDLTDTPFSPAELGAAELAPVDAPGVPR
jgi:hypothetical protein